MTVAIVYDDRYLDHDPGADHPEGGKRLEAIMDGIKARKLFDKEEWRLVKPRPASKNVVKSVHDPAYVDFIERLCLLGGGTIDEDTAACRDTFDVALLAAGGAIEGALKVLHNEYANAFALVRPPGHHIGKYGRALSAPSQGFCIFNNTAIAAAHCLKQIDKVFILDIDVHHGNGTQEIFEERSDVLFLSLHQQGIYPFSGSLQERGRGQGEGYTVNIPMPRGAGDDAYLMAFHEVVAPLARKFEPELILVSAGFDAHEEDPLAEIRLTDAGYLAIFDKIKKIAEEVCLGRFVVVLEGGYNLNVLFRLVPRVLEGMGGMRARAGPLSSSPQSIIKCVETNLRKLRKMLSKYHNFGSL